MAVRATTPTEPVKCRLLFAQPIVEEDIGEAVERDFGLMRRSSYNKNNSLPVIGLPIIHRDISPTPKITPPSNLIQFPKRNYTLAEAYATMKEANDQGYGVGAVVFQKLQNNASVHNPLSWGIVLSVSDVQRNGMLKPIGVRFLVGGVETHFFSRDELILVHEAKRPHQILSMTQNKDKE